MPKVWVVRVAYGGHEWDVDSIWSSEGAAQERSQDPEVRTIYNYDVDVIAYEVDPGPEQLL